nr:MAG TPA: hypothetical protein [Caudoviricetes sp.]
MRRMSLILVHCGIVILVSDKRDRAIEMYAVRELKGLGERERERLIESGLVCDKAFELAELPVDVVIYRDGVRVDDNVLTIQ